MELSFTKMHGLGNDFVIFDATNQPLNLTGEQIRFIADRHLGIGCDQLLLVEKSTKPNVDFRYRIFNADGGEVQQCGNGARCFARFVHDKGLTDKVELAVETLSGIIYPRLEENGEVTVDMGKPRLQPDEIPFIAKEVAPQYPIIINKDIYRIGAVSMGNPHAILIVDDLDNAPVAELGTILETHSRFPERVNVNFIQVINRSEIKLRVFERGVGETMACGTGACASAVFAKRMDLVDMPVKVKLRGGDLTVRWSGDEAASVCMTGAAVHVFDGKINL